jgi:hypothetical protein
MAQDHEEGKPGDRVAVADRDDDGRSDELLAEYEAERPARRLSGWVATLVTAVCVGLSLYAIYWVLQPRPRCPTGSRSWPSPSR